MELESVNIFLLRIQIENIYFFVFFFFFVLFFGGVAGGWGGRLQLVNRFYYES